jgi:RHS repeat-associated protein
MYSDVSQNSVQFNYKEATFFLYDHLGNTRVSYSKLDNGLVVHSLTDYFPYGKILREYVSTRPRYLTTQHERDTETDLDYRGARYYDSEYGRFLSVDPLANEYPSWSAYNYVMGNPIILIDPTGRNPEGASDSNNDEYEINKGTNKGGWTKNHLLMNEAFGRLGFNDVIDGFLPQEKPGKETKTTLGITKSMTAEESMETLLTNMQNYDYIESRDLSFLHPKAPSAIEKFMRISTSTFIIYRTFFGSAVFEKDSKITIETGTMKVSRQKEDGKWEKVTVSGYWLTLKGFDIEGDSKVFLDENSIYYQKNEDGKLVQGIINIK